MSYRFDFIRYSPTNDAAYSDDPVGYCLNYKSFLVGCHRGLGKNPTYLFDLLPLIHKFTFVEVKGLIEDPKSSPLLQLSHSGPDGRRIYGVRCMRFCSETCMAEHIKGCFPRYRQLSKNCFDYGTEKTYLQDDTEIIPIESNEFAGDPPLFLVDRKWARNQNSDTCT